MRTRLGCLLLTVLLVGACGDGSRPQERGAQEAPDRVDSALARLVAASGEKFMAQGGVKVSMKMSAMMPDAAGGGLLAGRGRGAFDYAAQEGRLNIKMTSSGAVPLNVKMSAITDYPIMYMNFGNLFKQVPQPPPGLKPWIRFNFETVADQVGIDMDALMQFGQNDLSSYALYTQGVEDVQRVGRETVRGRPATHYRATVDFERLTEVAPENLRATFEALRRMTGVSEVPMDVWIDDRDLVVRQRLDMPLPSAVPGETMTTTMDMTFYGFGTEVEIDLPPESKVMDFEELLQMSPGAYPEEATVTPSEEGT